MPENLILESTILHVVMPRDLNHHGTLFAGQMASWLVEAGFIAAARVCGKPEDVVCVQVNEMTFKKPINLGDVIEIRSNIAHLGSSSISVQSDVFRKQDTSPLVSNLATFVTVDKNNKPYKHNLELPAEYIATHRDLYDEAVKKRKRN